MSDIADFTKNKAVRQESNRVEDYARHLAAYVSTPDESILHHAYELGRQAVSDGVSVLDMAILHHNALQQISASRSSATQLNYIEKAALFFTESLSPFEMLLRRYRESNVSLLAERKMIEQQLRQIQKMEAIGQLTGGIAHDFNNLLGIIIGNIELLLESAQGDQAEFIHEVMNASLRGAELTRRLLAFARQQPLNPRVVNLNERLPDAARMLKRTLGENIRITLTLADNLWPANVDPSQVEDAIINLAINSRDAMPNGGDLTIETANTTLDKQYAARNLEVAAGDYVMLSVSDTGMGMPPDVIERATEPFFTTKKPGQGTGLGLSMIYGFVRQSGGHFKIESTVGAGTTMRLYLPKAQDESCDGKDEAPQKTAPIGGESILVVDDNAGLRQLAARLLSKLGYKVHAAENGIQALEVLETEGPFDLLFSDIGLPDGMDGYELAAAARKRQPRLKVLFTTGYTKVQENEQPHMIRKPYRKQELAEKIRTALDSKSDSR
jgi:signal transduction histidine kinase